MLLLSLFLPVLSLLRAMVVEWLEGAGRDIRCCGRQIGTGGEGKRRKRRRGGDKEMEGECKVITTGQASGAGSGLDRTVLCANSTPFMAHAPHHMNCVWCLL